MNMIRAFIAIRLSDEIEHGLAGLLDDLKKRLPKAPVRWVPAQNIHLTIKFLGDVSPSNIDLLTKMLQTETARHPPFEIQVGGLGAFPSSHRPRVVWVAVTAPGELATLQRGVEGEMLRLGYAPEERGFSPHLTLGRVNRNAGAGEVRDLASLLDTYKVGSLGSMQVSSVNLYRSELNPGGSVYTSLFTAKLSDPTA